MSIKEKQNLYHEITEFLKSKGATKVAVFGSYVRDEETPESDLDIIIDFKRPIGLIEFVGIEQDLSEKIGIKVDLGSELKPYLEPYIRDEIIYLL